MRRPAALVAYDAHRLKQLVLLSATEGEETNNKAVYSGCTTAAR